MGSHIINIVLILLLGLIVFIFIKRNNANKFHLDYFIIHTFLLLLSTAIYKGIIFNIVDVVFFDLINTLHIASLVFLILHVKSAIKGVKSKINWFFLIPNALYFLIITLNYFGVYILNYRTEKVIFLLVQIIDPIYFSDKMLIKLVANTTLVVYLFKFCNDHINSSVTIKKIRLYKVWIYSYQFLMFETLLLNCSYYFSVFNPIFDSYIHLMTRINAILSLIFFFMYPVFLNYLPLIKRVDVFDREIIENTFTLVKNLFQNERLYLKKRITIEDVVNSVGSTKKKVQKAILINTQLNFNDFVNAHRINKSIELINNNYLIKMNLKSLAIASGFNSHQTFYRAFKKVMGCTPTEYRKKILK